MNSTEMAFAILMALREKAKEAGKLLPPIPLLDAFVLAGQKGLDAMGHLGPAADILHGMGLCVVTETDVDARGMKAEAIALSQQGRDTTDAEIRATFFFDVN